jgi:hypothetical protein
MAKKGQKFKKYDLEFKNKVLKEYQEEASAGYLSKKYDIPIGTIFTWTTIKKKHGALGVVKKGRPTIIHEKDYKERYEILKKYQDFLVTQEQKKR